MIWILRTLLLLPALVVAALALPRFEAGILLNRSFPATAYIQTNTPLPTASYAQVARLLAGASTEDSETAILRAEAAIDAGQPIGPIITSVDHALATSPLLARGWIILASLLTDRDPQLAVDALTLAYDLAPHEYYLAFPRMLVAAPLWDHLPARMQVTLFDDVNSLADDQEKHSQLRILLSKPGGPNLVVRSFTGRPDALRELNRSLAREALHL